ncbi:basic proline-rich protein-like [Lutra lutra]|uniref:basic proline-rich protein-like n=1 Tax=Lutra lutra TaxID=9657 RepID=UPI001FD13AEF|nr:basic proline-rich protein-like [Lutra lutra]
MSLMADARAPRVPGAQGALSNFPDLPHTRARAHTRPRHPGPTCPRGRTRTLPRLLRGRRPAEHPCPPAPCAPDPAPGSGPRARLRTPRPAPDPAPGSGARRARSHLGLCPAADAAPLPATAAVGGPAQPPGRRPTHSSRAPAGPGALGKARIGGARPAPGTRPLTPAAPPAVHFSGSSGRPRGRDSRWARPPRDPTGEGSRRGRCPARGGGEAAGAKSRGLPAGVLAPVAPRSSRLPDPVPGSPHPSRAGAEPCGGSKLAGRPAGPRPPRASPGNSHSKLPATVRRLRPGNVAFFSVLPEGFHPHPPAAAREPPTLTYPSSPALRGTKSWSLSSHSGVRGAGSLQRSGKNLRRTEETRQICGAAREEPRPPSDSTPRTPGPPPPAPGRQAEPCSSRCRPDAPRDPPLPPPPVTRSAADPLKQRGLEDPGPRQT